MSALVHLALLLSSAGIPAAAAPGPDRAASLLRLPGPSGASCLSCHEERNIPESASPAAFRSHVLTHLPRLSTAEIEGLQRHVAGLRSRSGRAPQATSAPLAESIRGLGYVEYRTGRELPILRRGLHLNAHELQRLASGPSRLLATEASPTGAALELDGAALAGLVLPEAGADPGTYRLTLRFAAPVSEAPVFVSISGPGMTTLDTRMRRSPSPAPAEAAASFRIDQPVPVTIALAPAGPAAIAIADVRVERQ
jgi:hypothetical protein